MQRLTTGHCFWCGLHRRLTRDHVQPKVAGGKDAHNVVMACDHCQKERGCVQSFYGEAKRWRLIIMPIWNEWKGKGKLRRHYNAINKQRHYITLLVQKWTEIEQRRWGHSPTALLDLSMPIPPAPVPHTVVDWSICQ